MPIFKHDGKLYYFAHVPKTGGSAVETYLAKRFGTLSFLAAARNDPKPIDSWGATSPQHVECDVLEALVPQEWFTESFAVVRDPVARLRSAYRYKNRNRQPWRTRPFEAWARRAMRKSKSNPRYKDNHIRPQSDIVPANATVFRFEEGLDQIVPFLDGITNTNQDGLKIESVNVSPTIRKSETPITSSFAKDVFETYQEDYRRFGYPKPNEVTIPAG